MKRHLIKDYVMMELANNAIIDIHTATDSQTQTWMILKYNTTEYWSCEDWTEPWKIFWEYGEGEGIFYGTDAEFNQFTRWADAELQSIISDDL